MALYRPLIKLADGRRVRSPYWWYEFKWLDHRYRASTGEKKKDKAREKETERRKEIRSGRREIKPITFTALADEYLHLHAEAKRAADFYRNTVTVLRRWFGARPVAGITPRDCEGFLADRRQAVGPSTANSSVMVLKHMLKKAEEWGYLAEGTNPARRLKREKVRPRERHASREEADALVAACHENLAWLRPIVLTALHTGGRRGEILGLTWADINFEAGTLTYRDTKNGDARTVPLGRILAAELRALPNRLRPGRVYQCKERGAEKKNWRPITNEMLRGGFHAACRRASVAEPCGCVDGLSKHQPDAPCARCDGTGRFPSIRFHDLRHTWATWLAGDGVPLRTLQYLGGWRRLEMVMRYAGVSKVSREAAAEAIDRIFAARSPLKSPLAPPEAGAPSAG